MAYVAGTPPKPPDKAKKSFFDMHSHGFVRVATAVPRSRRRSTSGADCSSARQKR